MEKKLRILILEDNAADAGLMIRALKKEKLRFESRRVETKGAFLRELENFKPTIILADYTLPAFDAMMAIKLVNQYKPKVPLIVVTGSISEEVAVKCMKTGAADYVLKDHLIHLGMAVRTALEKKDMEDEKEGALEELRKSEEKYRVLANASPDGILATGKSGNLTYINPALERMFAVPSPEAIGTNFRKYLTKDSQKEAVKAFLELSRGEAFRKLEFDAVHNDGHVFPIEVTASPIMKNHNFIGMEAIVRDVTKRKWAEELLRENEEKYRNLSERANDGICVVQDATIKYVNPRLAEMLGYRVEEATGAKFPQYIHPDERERIKVIYERRIVGKEGRQKYETSLLHKDGHKVEVEVNSGIIPYEGKQAILVIIRDITERKEAEEALRRSEAMLSSIFTAAPIGMGLVTDRVFQKINKKVSDMVGYTEEELKGKDVRIIYPDDEEYERVGREKYDQIKWKGVGIMETRFRHKDGHVIDALLSSSPVDPADLSAGVIFTAMDITARKEAETELKKSEERFRQIVENSREWIWEVDTKGMYTFASPVAESILGYRPEEIVGKKYFYDFFHPDVREDMKEAAFEFFARKKPFRDFVNRNLHRDGSTIWLLTSAVPILDEKGELIGYRGADTDITDRKTAEENTLKTLEELKQYKEVTVGRELEMIELKKQVNELSKELGKGEPFDLTFSE